MDWPGWADAVLKAGGWPDTPANVRFLTSWHPFEQSKCSNNPLNTTLRVSGSSNCVQTATPSIWVQSYPTRTVGANATADTFKGIYFPNIRAALRQGDPYAYPLSQAVAAEISRWGTPLYAAQYLTQVGGGTSGAGGAPAPPGVTGSSVDDAARSLAGYHSLNQAFARRLPTSLSRSQRIRRATLRRLPH